MPKNCRPWRPVPHYLTLIRHNWDAAFKTHPLAEQDVVLTLPASFDQVARQLTIEAAAQAGLKRVLPIEEPQAAFYAWLARHSQGVADDDNWERLVHAGETILVCDIGGGTTDFTLIRVREATETSDQDSSETLDACASTQTVIASCGRGTTPDLGRR